MDGIATFSLNNKNNLTEDDKIKIFNTVFENIGYFKYFNSKGDYMDTLIETYVHLMERYDPNMPIKPYMKILARTLPIVANKRNYFPISTYSDDGEVSREFLSLKTTIEIDSIKFSSLLDKLRDLYLMFDNDFLALKWLYKDEDLQTHIKNKDLQKSIQKLCYDYGSDYIYKGIYLVLEELNKDLDQNICITKIKELNFKKGNFQYLNRIESDTLEYKNHKYSIDKSFLTMPLNPDFIDWNLPSKYKNYNVLKIDMIPLLDYVSEHIYADVGVNNRYIKWCNNRYKLISPSGMEHLNFDRAKFLTLVRNELILNLLQIQMKIVAISNENCYIRTNRENSLTTLRLNCFDGKIIDLPVSVYIKNRK